MTRRRRGRPVVNAGRDHDLFDYIEADTQGLPGMLNAAYAKVVEERRFGFRNVRTVESAYVKERQRRQAKAKPAAPDPIARIVSAVASLPPDCFVPDNRS